MPAHEPPREPGRKRNRKILDRWLAREREAKRPLLARMASLLAREADANATVGPDWPDEVPEELLDLLDTAFEAVPILMQDAGWAA